MNDNIEINVVVKKMLKILVQAALSDLYTGGKLQGNLFLNLPINMYSS